MHDGNPMFLYVEDDAFSQEIMKRMMKTLGYSNLMIFENSHNFLDRVHALPNVPDVVFLDIQIGPLNGHQLLRLLRDDDTFKETKIIAMTASVMSSEVNELRDAGFDGLIGKPILKRIFPELLKEILDGADVWYVS